MWCYVVKWLLMIQSMWCYVAKWLLMIQRMWCCVVNGCWWFKQSQSFLLQDQAVQENCLTPKMVLRFNAISNWPNNKAETASNLALCGITGGNVRFIHLVITSHMKRSHIWKHFITRSYKTLTVQHTSVTRTERVAGHIAGRELTCACNIVIQNS